MMQNYFEMIAPGLYEEHAIVAHEALSQMYSRLDYITLQPKLILDVGCGVGTGSQLLKKRYPTATVFGIDSALNFLSYAREQHREGIQWIGAEAIQLPLREYSVDLIFANMLLPWCADLKKIFQRWQKLLKPGGLLMFTTLGPDTLLELKQAIRAPTWIDMHDIGDELVHAGFLDPVLDAECLVLNYRTQQQLVCELQSMGMLPQAIQLPNLAKNQNPVFSLTFEVVYGHAWGAASTGYFADESGVVKIPLASLKKT
jgi:malonyl-CoA O-methyltransferase